MPQSALCQFGTCKKCSLQSGLKFDISQAIIYIQYILSCTCYKKLSLTFSRDEVLELDLMEVLLNIHDTTDHEAWELVDQAMTILKDIAPYSKKSSASSTVQSDDGSGPSSSQNNDKDKHTEAYQRKKNNTIHFNEP